MRVRRVGILTAGGIAPCLSAAIGSVIAAYGQRDPAVEILCYRFGYAGLLRGDSFPVTDAMRRCMDRLLCFGGSVLGNSRGTLENRADCMRRRLGEEGQDPQAVAAERLAADTLK